MIRPLKKRLEWSGSKQTTNIWNDPARQKTFGMICPHKNILERSSSKQTPTFGMFRPHKKHLDLSGSTKNIWNDPAASKNKHFDWSGCGAQNPGVQERLQEEVDAAYLADKQQQDFPGYDTIQGISHTLYTNLKFSR